MYVAVTKAHEHLHIHTLPLTTRKVSEIERRAQVLLTQRAISDQLHLSDDRKKLASPHEPTTFKANIKSNN